MTFENLVLVKIANFRGYLHALLVFDVIMGGILHGRPN
jgi:hypothetical protein